MKKRAAAILLAGVLTAALAGCGCGSGQASKNASSSAGSSQASGSTSVSDPGAASSGSTSSSAASEAGSGEADAAGAQSDGTYESTDGWSVRYNPADMTAEEGADGVSFVSSKDASGNSRISVRFIKDKQPEEALTELTSSWGNDEAVERSEGFFPGTTDKWSFRRTLPASGDSGVTKEAIAGEYNDGVLLFDISSAKSGDEDADMAVSDAIAGVLDSISFKNFGAQKMYDYVPGTYIFKNGDGGTFTVTLNDDHTGTLSLDGEDIPVTWGSTELTSADDPSRTWEYTIEGENLMLNMDGEWQTFEKQQSDLKYPGSDPLEAAVAKYIVDELGKNYDPAAVAIPSFTIVDKDESNPDDILVWGDFEYYNYNKDGDKLVTSAGGLYSGLMHLKKNADGSYEVTGMDMVEDGSNFDESAKKIFGDRYDAFMKIHADDHARNQTRAKFIADYVTANGLSSTQYQDYGWDPVDLPTVQRG